jgi:hypothetical protein
LGFSECLFNYHNVVAFSEAFFPKVPGDSDNLISNHQNVTEKYSFRRLWLVSRHCLDDLAVRPYTEFKLHTVSDGCSQSVTGVKGKSGALRRCSRRGKAGAVPPL